MGVKGVLAAFTGLLMAIASSGCMVTDEEGSHGHLKPPGYRLEGSFEAGVEMAQIAQLRSKAEDVGGLMWTTDSTPPRFDIMGLADLAACQDIREFATGADYVASLGECRWWQPD